MNEKISKSLLNSAYGITAEAKTAKAKSLLNSAYGITAERETAETKETTDPEVGKFVYDVVIHNFYGCDTYTVRANGCESAKDKALKIMKYESLDDEYSSIDSIRIYKENSDELLKEIIFEPPEAKPETATDPESAETEDTHIDDIKKFKEKADLNSFYGEATEPLTVYQFERLTGTLYKSLFKALGLEETEKIPFIISNNMVFFNYNGTQYKYYPSQCKIFKKCGRKYQRINWKDFADDNSPTDQKQALGRSPPLLLFKKCNNLMILNKRSNKDMNKFILKGCIGNIENGKTYTKISIATIRSYKNDKEEYETDWFNAVAFGGTADFISKYFSKGDMILAEGNIQNNEYIDKEGVEHHSYSFIINTVEFCGKSVKKSSDKNIAYKNNGYKNKR